MDQLILDLSEPPAPTFDNFVMGRNAELVETLRTLAQGHNTHRLVYLWGESGCGRSHLLHAAAAASASFRLPIGQNALRVVDDVEELDAAGAHSLFKDALAALAGEGYVLASGNLPPASLTLREDLRSRLGAGLVFRVLPLSDDEKLAALRARAVHLGFELPVDVGAYLLRHSPRDMPTLLRTLDALDRMSVKLRRAVTLPLVRACLHEG